MGLKLNSITIADRVIRKEEMEREREKGEKAALIKKIAKNSKPTNLWRTEK